MTTEPTLTQAAGSGQLGASSGPAASLYVGDLHPEVTEAMLYEIFNQIGPVSSIRICRDAISRRSLGYAYVNFHSLSDGERAMEILNYTPIKGQTCRIMWSQRDPSVRKSGHGNIFIKNLDKSIDNKTLHDTFSSFGHILSCKVVGDKDGNSKGFGFVHFETQESAEMAIDQVNNMLIEGSQVFVGRHLTKKERQQQLESVRAHFSNVFIKNLDENFSEDQLKELFGQYGEIVSAVIQFDEGPEKKSKGFGFVNFANHEQAQRAVDGLNGRIVAGKEIYVGRAQKKSERIEELRRQFESMKLERLQKYQGVNVYVKNLVETVDEDRLRVEFGPFGTISSCKVMQDDTGVSRGFGFICYSSPEEAARAITEMNGRMLLGKPLYVALAQRREDRRAQLEAQFAARTQQLRYGPAAAGYYAAMPGAAMYPQAPALFVPHATQPYLPNRLGRPSSYQQQINPRVAYPANMPSQNVMSSNGGSVLNQQGAVTARQGMRPAFVRPSNFLPGYQQSISSNPQQLQSNFQLSNNSRRPVYAQSQGPNRPVSRYMGTNAPTTYQQRPLYQARPLNAASLAAAAPDQQRRMLGERLFPVVQTRHPELAGKLTGMLLEMNPADLLHLMESPEALHAKIDEAREVLRDHLSKVSNSS